MSCGGSFFTGCGGTSLSSLSSGGCGSSSFDIPISTGCGGGGRTLHVSSGGCGGTTFTVSSGCGGSSPASGEDIMRAFEHIRNKRNL